MQRVCAGSIDLKKNTAVEQCTTELSQLLREKLGATAGINMSDEREVIRDMRIYDPKTDKIVSFLGLTDLPEYFNIDYPSFKDISRLLMDGHTIFFPQRNGLGEVDRNNPIMLCGGDVDGKFHLQIHDKQTQETMKHLDTTVQKPGFLDWVADLFRRVFTKMRDPICEVWEKYAPLRKISSKQKALNTEDHLYYAHHIQCCHEMAGS